MSMRSMKLPLALAFTLLATLLALSPFASVLHADAHSAATSTTNLASLVDPFTGTGTQAGASFGGGDTFPGADVPFGLVQLSPDTANYVSGGYDYTDNRIKGFSLTHLNGAGCSTYSDIPFMPYVGTVTTSPASNPAQYLSTFSHSNESATAGYYQVKLDNGVNTELSATLRSGAARFTYPAGQTASLLVNVSGSINGVQDAQADIGSNTISGWASSGKFCGASDIYRVYFWAQFSQPFASIGTWYNNILTPGASSAQGSSTASPAVSKVIAAQKQMQSAQGQASKNTAAQAQAHPDTTVSGPGSGAYVTFNTAKTTAISVRIGVSFVSVNNAKANVNQENASGNFDAVHKAAVQTWNNRLGEIKISGGSAQEQATFYTALYHALLQPDVFSDVNGQYIGFDGRTHTAAKGHAQYANYSGWDIYRSEAQLLGLLAPNEASDIAQSMVNDYQQGGTLPKWTLANAETYVMVGDPADAILADIYAFGGTKFDTKAALAAMKAEATQTNNARPGLNYLENQGYLPLNGSYGCCNYYGAASTTLEYNSADFAIGAFAQALNDTTDYQTFVKRAQDWANLLNPADSYLEPRKLDGSFQSPYNPDSGTGWVEGDGAQYNWMVPFNLRGLFDEFGGNSQAVARLNTFFTQLNSNPNAPYAFLGNEPTLETPWEYDYAGAPYKTQQIVRTAVNTLYSTGPGGLAGNDDLGEMSSWYVFATLGLFPETPGTADLALASPLFSSITIKRPSGQTLQINAPGAATNTYYVQSLKLNGQTSTKPWVPASFVSKGGTLDFTLSTSANTTWGTSTSDAPPSYQYGQIPVRTSFDPGRAVVAPGASTSVSFVANSITTTATTINWSATAPAGLTVTPASGSFTVPAQSNASQSFTLAADASLAEGYYSLALSATASDGTPLSSVTLPIVVAKPGNLLAVYNNIGISDDSSQATADFDGDGFSYSAQQLATNGYKPGATVTVNGISYTWPNMASGSDDNVIASGQVFALPAAKAGASQLSFLGSASNGPSSGTLTITYTDGTTQTATLGLSDWTLGAGGETPSFGNVVATHIPYRNSTSGTAQQITTYVFATAPIQLDTSKQVASVTFPASTDQGELHIFALTVS